MRRLAFSPDGKTLAVLNHDLEAHGVTLWDVSTGKVTATLHSEHRRAGQLLAFTPDGKSVLVSGDRPMKEEEKKLGMPVMSAKVWDLESKKVRLTIDFPPGAGVGGVLTPDGTTLIVPTWEKGAALYDVKSGKEVGTIDCDKDLKGATAIALSPDGKTLALGMKSGAIFLWSMEKKAALRTVPAFDHYVEVLAFSPDGATVAASAASGKAELWTVANGKHMDTLDVGLRINGINDIVYAPDGKSVALVGTGLCLALWDFAAGGERDDFGGPEHPLKMACAAFSPDGKTLVVGGLDKTIQLWDVPQGKPTGVKPRE